MRLRWMCSLTLLFALPLAAQEEATTLPPTVADGQLSRDDAAMRSRFGLWGGVATHSPVRARYGVLYRDMFLLGIRGSWGLVGSRYVTLRYAVDFIPLAISTNNPSRIVVDTVVGGYTAGTRDSLATSTTYGVGVAPLGLEVRLFPRQRLGVLVEGTGGIIWYNRPIPDPTLRKLNFTAEVGAGLEMALGSRDILTVGYKYHHTSNGGTAPVNPGLNSGVVYAGFSHRRD